MNSQKTNYTFDAKVFHIGEYGRERAFFSLLTFIALLLLWMVHWNGCLSVNSRTILIGMSKLEKEFSVHLTK